jgi:hypothetical protein
MVDLIRMAEQAKRDDLLNRVVEILGLTPMIGSGIVRRALVDAGEGEDATQPHQFRRALSHIQERLATYLSEDEAQTTCQQIDRALSRPSFVGALGASGSVAPAPLESTRPEAGPARVVPSIAPKGQAGVSHQSTISAPPVSSGEAASATAAEPHSGTEPEDAAAKAAADDAVARRHADDTASIRIRRSIELLKEVRTHLGHSGEVEDDEG